jgi:hypothetical protein
MVRNAAAKPARLVSNMFDFPSSVSKSPASCRVVALDRREDRIGLGCIMSPGWASAGAAAIPVRTARRDVVVIA